MDSHFEKIAVPFSRKLFSTDKEALFFNDSRLRFVDSVV